MKFIGVKKAEWQNIDRCPKCGKVMQTTKCISNIPIDGKFIHASYIRCPKCGYMPAEQPNNSEMPPVDYTHYPTVKVIKVKPLEITEFTKFKGVEFERHTAAQLQQLKENLFNSL